MKEIAFRRSDLSPKSGESGVPGTRANGDLHRVPVLVGDQKVRKISSDLNFLRCCLMLIIRSVLLRDSTEFLS